MKLAFITDEDFAMLGHNHMSFPVQDAEHIQTLLEAVEVYMEKAEQSGEDAPNLITLTNLHTNLILCTPDD